MAITRRSITDYAPGDPNTPSYLRTAANGWNGSFYVGSGTTDPHVGTQSQDNFPNGLPPINADPGYIPPGGSNAPYTAPIPPINTTQPIPNGPPPPPPVNTAPPLSNGDAGYATDWGGGNTAQQQQQLQDAINAGAPAGFDAQKWQNTQHQSAKYVAGRIIAAGGGVGDVLHALDAAGIKGYSAISGSTDKIKGPNGEIIDLIFDEEGKHLAAWNIVSGHSAGWKPPAASQNVALPPPQQAPANSTLGAWDDFLGSLNNDTVHNVGVNQQQGMQGNVGQDWFSQLLTGGTADLIGRGGATEFGQDVNATLADVIRGSAGGPNRDRMNAHLETARENAGLAQRAMANDARGALASRGLLSEPGTPQGPEISAMTRISESIAPQFAQALRDAQIEESQLADQRLMQGLGLATSQSQSQGSNLLGALGEGTNRQTALAQIALGTLDRNILWNKFLAEYGLDRIRVANEIQNGRISNLNSLLQLFAVYVEKARQGQIGAPL